MRSLAMFRLSSRRAVRVAVGGAVIPGLLGACVPAFGDESGRITEPRVLGVWAEPAEVKPGGTAELRALFVDKDGRIAEGGALEWALCLARRPLTEVGPVAPSCLAEFGRGTVDVPQIGVGESVSAVIPADVCRRFGPLSPALEPGQTVPGRVADPDTTGGFFQPILVGEGEPVVARLRVLCGPSGLPQEESVIFNQGYRPNERPEPSEVFVERDGELSAVAEELTVALGQEVRLVVKYPACPTEPDCGDGFCSAYENASNCAVDCGELPLGCGGPESYLYADPVTRTTVENHEHLEIGWFSAAGRFEVATTDDEAEPGVVRNAWKAPTEAQSSIIWLISRDDRGGVSWRSIDVRVGEP